MKILGIAGNKGAGKTTLASNLSIATSGRCVPMAFADPLKDICVDVLGLRRDQVHGTEADKNTLTEYRAHQLPEGGEYGDIESPLLRLTVRQVMQRVGTEVFRRIDPLVWAKALLRRASRLLPDDIAVVHDVRFPDEAKAINDAGGKVIWLNRGIKGDGHASETSLTIDSPELAVLYADMPAGELSGMVFEKLKEWGWL
jgi:hypothetical protein